jgi:hypothetical protein
MAFFDCWGLIYIHIVPSRAKINAEYIIKALGTFTRHFKKKRPEMVSREWCFLWDHAPVHTTAIVQAWLAFNQVHVLKHPLPDLAPADYYLFWRVKEELSGIQLTLESLKNTWVGVIRSIGVAKFATAFRCWLDRCNKCIQRIEGYVNKF